VLVIHNFTGIAEFLNMKNYVGLTNKHKIANRMESEYKQRGPLLRLYVMGSLRKVGTDDYCDCEGCLTKTKCSFPLNYIFFPRKKSFSIQKLCKDTANVHISIAVVY
jgi:hypothetical protein